MIISICIYDDEDRDKLEFFYVFKVTCSDSAYLCKNIKQIYLFGLIKLVNRRSD